MAGAGYKLFNTGDVLTAAQVNTYLQEQTVMVFANSTARTTALSGVLAEGMMSYLQDTNTVQVYNGTSWVGIGGSSPLTTKGDLYGFSTVDARIPIGTNGHVLTADSTQTLGLKWAASSAGALTLIERATFTTTTSVITGAVFSATYDNYLVILNINSSAASNWSHKWRMRTGSTTTTAGYTFGMNTADEGGNTSGYGESNSAAWDLTFGNATVGGFYRFEIGNPNASQYTHVVGQLTRPGGTTSITARHFGGFVNDTNSYDKLDILFAQNSSGYYAVYGYGK